MGKNKVVIFAAGNGERMKSDVPKQFLKLDGVPIVIMTILKFNKNKNIDEIIVSIKKGYKDYLEKELKKYTNTDNIKIIEPKNSDTGLDSTYYGLKEAAKKMNDDDIVLIHDGVRPIISNELINENIKTCKKYGNAISCSESYESIIEISEDKKVIKSLKRKNHRITKSPQTFFLKDILKAHENIRKKYNSYENFTDSSEIMLAQGNTLNIVECSNNNIKITDENDIYKVMGLLNKDKYKNILNTDNPLI